MQYKSGTALIWCDKAEHFKIMQSVRGIGLTSLTKRNGVKDLF